MEIHFTSMDLDPKILIHCIIGYHCIVYNYAFADVEAPAKCYFLTLDIIIGFLIENCDFIYDSNHNYM